MLMTSRDLRWLNYVQNAAVAVLAVFHAVGGVQAAVDLGGVVVEVVEVVEVVIVVAVEDLGVMVAVVPIEVAVVHNLLFSQKKTHGVLVVSRKFRVSVPSLQGIPI
jgi:hypothetical protein